jgi:hypothetical protein
VVGFSIAEIAEAPTEIPVTVLPAALAVAVTGPSVVSRSVPRRNCEALMPKTVAAVSPIDVADTAPRKLTSNGTTLSNWVLRDTPVTFAASPARPIPVTVTAPLTFSVAEPSLDVLPKVELRPVTSAPPDAGNRAAEASNVPETAPLMVALLVPPPPRPIHATEPP